ncbi:MAG: carbohydrate ABC transporter permease [bacterium]|nr:carbohydrate ABC transporter permease [bacterium]
MTTWRALFLAVMLLFAVGPVYLLIKISVSPPAEVMTAHPTFVPHGLTGRHWQRVVSSGQVIAPMRKSLVVASSVALFAIVLGAPAAYSLIQLPLNWRYGILLGLFACRMLPEVSIAMPIAVVFLRWGLMDTQIGLVLAHLTMVLPVAVWILTTTFAAIPRQIEEAAALDGCGTLRTLVYIIFPLALPGLVVGALLSWLFSWEEFILATYLTLGEKTMPLQVYYYLYQGNWFVTAVTATLMAVPVLLLSIFLQRYLQQTNLAGVIR